MAFITIAHKDFRILNKMGSGGFSRVYEVNIYQSSKLRISNKIFISLSSKPLRGTNFLNLLMPFDRRWARTKWCEQSRWSTPWAWRGRSTERS